MSTDSRPRSFPGVFVAASLAWGLGAATAAAAPITFGFNAVVTDVRLDSLSPVTFPFQVKTGDVIRGRFTFTSPPQGNYGVQTTGIEFDLGGSTIIAPTYHMRAAKDQIVPASWGDRVHIDTLTISTSLAQSPTLDSPGAPGLRWRPFLQFSGPSPILENYELQNNPGIWNLFPMRGLSLSFANSLTSLRIEATVQEIRAVPELSAGVGVLSLVIIGILGRKAKRPVALAARIRAPLACRQCETGTRSAT